MRSGNQLILTGLILMAVGSLSLAGETKITEKETPAAVLDSFHASYPTARILARAKEIEKGKTLYELETIDGKAKRDILYEQSGKVVEIEEAIDSTAIPSAIKKSCETEFPDGKIARVEKITGNGTVTYELIVLYANKKVEATFNISGKLLKKEVVRAARAKGKANEKRGSENDED